MIEISQEAVDLIVTEEVSSKAVYISQYQRPTWPGGSSGVTVGIGYDLAYSTREQIAADWGRLVTPQMLAAMQRCAGVTGDSAHMLMRQVHDSILISWDAAMDVFMNRDVPKWTAICRQHLPNFDELSPDSKGALVSVAYNRGPSFDNAGDRFREMRAIKAHMIAREFGKISAEFESMKRLWPNMSGLRHRRDHEAALFEKGLSHEEQPKVAEVELSKVGEVIQSPPSPLSEQT